MRRLGNGSYTKLRPFFLLPKLRTSAVTTVAEQVIKAYGSISPLRYLNCFSPIRHFSTDCSTREPDSTDTHELFQKELRAVEQDGWAFAEEDLGPRLTAPEDPDAPSFFLYCLEHAGNDTLRKLVKSSIFEQVAGTHRDEILHAALRRGDDYLLSWVINHCNINKRDQRGFTPLMVAIMYRSTHKLSLALYRGADYYKPCNLPLSKWPSVHSLIQKESINFTPLSLAVQSGGPYCVNAVIAEGKESIEACTGNELGNLLHIAVAFRQSETLSHLLEHYRDECRALVKMTNWLGQTPLALAAALGYTKSISLLTEYGAPLEARGPDGLRAMDWAVKHERGGAILELRRLGASTLDLRVNIEDISNASLQTTLRNLQVGEKRGYHRPGDFSQAPVTNLAFQGGGPRGIGHIGVLRVLEKEGVLSSACRLGGTSVGAIIAAMLSVGYTPDEIEHELRQKNLMTLLDVPVLDQKKHALKVARAKGLVKTLLAVGSDPLSTGVGLASLFINQGVAKGELLHRWIEGLIAKKTKVDNFTFKELAERAEQPHLGYKHLWVFATEIQPNEALLTFSSRFAEKDEFRHLTVASGVTASATVPGLFEPFQLLFKDDKPEPKGKKLPRKVVDGGLILNFPFVTWNQYQYTRKDYHPRDAETYEENPQTLGIGFSKPSNDTSSDLKKMTTLQLVRRLWNIYSNVESSLRPPNSRHSIIEIDPGEVTLIDFDLSSEDQDKLISRGEVAARAFFRRKTRPSLFGSPAPDIDVPDPELKTKLKAADFPPALLDSIKNMYKRHFARQALVTPNLPVNGPSLVYALCGCPGSGTTELAKQFVKQNIDEFSFVFWINAESNKALHQSHRDLCRQLKISTDKLTDEEVGETLRRSLEYHPFKKPWLLVYDGVTQYLEYPDYGGFVLTTSANTDLWSPQLTCSIPFLGLGQNFQPSAHRVDSDKDQLNKLAQKWSPFLDDLKQHNSVAHDLLHLLPAHQATGGAPLGWCRNYLKTRGMKDSVIEARLKDALRLFSRHSLIDQDRLKQSHLALFPSLDLVLLSGDADRSKIAYDYLSDYGDKVASSLDPIDPSDDSKHSLWRNNVSALLSSPYLDIPPEIRAKLYLQMGSIEEGLLKYDEAHDSFAAGLDALAQIDNPEIQKGAYRDVAFLWAGLHRLLVALLRYPEVREKLRFHGGDIFLGYQCLDDAEFYEAALNTTIQEIRQNHPPNNGDIERYLTLLKKRLRDHKRWFKYHSPWEDLLNFTSEISGHKKIGIDLESCLGDVFRNLRGELMISSTQHPKAHLALQSILYTNKHIRFQDKAMSQYFVCMSEHELSLNHFSAAYAYGEKAVEAAEPYSDEIIMTKEWMSELGRHRLDSAKAQLLKIESKDPVKKRSLEELNAEYRQLHPEFKVYGGPPQDRLVTDSPEKKPTKK